MKKKIELPLATPMYSTYHNQTPGMITTNNNKSIRNFYLNQIMLMHCNRAFLRGLTTPELDIKDVQWEHNPYLEKKYYEMKYLKGYVNVVIRNLLDDGYYVYFDGIDDYYVEGKSWYKERHSYHDGMICGYNQEKKTYCIYAYDSNWIYQKFWTPIDSFEKGRKSMFNKNKYGYICGIKASEEQIEFSSDIALRNIGEYLDSYIEKYPEEVDGPAYGIVVHYYLAKYIDKLIDGSIPYERKDRRIFRLIWEHKRVMYERIVCIEKELGLNHCISEKYENIVKESNNIRMLYASYNMRRRDAILLTIKNKLLALYESEKNLLTLLIKIAKENGRL